MSALNSTLGNGAIDVLSAIVVVLLALAAGAGGGALGGIRVGGKDLGNGLASMMGMFYGPVATLPAAFIVIVTLFAV
jgi:hypothetical protein